MTPLKLAAVVLAACITLAACASDPWVVSEQVYTRSPGHEQWSVICVPLSQLPKPHGTRSPEREIEVTKAVEESIPQGAPCPDGVLLSTD